MNIEQEKSLIDKTAKQIREWQEANPQATLTEMERAIDEELEKLRRQIITGLVKERESQEDGKTACPNCERNMGKNGKRKRRLKTKGGEEIEYERQQMRCFHCGMTLFPPR